MVNQYPSVLKRLPYYTYSDYSQWKGDRELISGIPYAMVLSPFSRHQFVITELIYQIRRQIDDCPSDCYVFTVLDWIVSDDTVLRPDLVLVCHRVKDYIKSPPEVVFEVVSEKSAQKDEYIKFEIYEKEKVPWYILVYPDIKKARIFKLKKGAFEKIADCTDEKFLIRATCQIEIDFKKLWYQ